MSHPGAFTLDDTTFGKPLSLIIASGVDNEGLEVVETAQDGDDVSVYAPGNYAECASNEGDKTEFGRGTSDGKCIFFFLYVGCLT